MDAPVLAQLLSQPSMQRCHALWLSWHTAADETCLDLLEQHGTALRSLDFSLYKAPVLLLALPHLPQLETLRIITAFALNTPGVLGLVSQCSSLRSLTVQFMHSTMLPEALAAAPGLRGLLHLSLLGVCGDTALSIDWQTSFASAFTDHTAAARHPCCGSCPGRCLYALSPAAVSVLAGGEFDSP
jgi:hypothetical protein